MAKLKQFKSLTVPVLACIPFRAAKASQLAEPGTGSRKWPKAGLIIGEALEAIRVQWDSKACRHGRVLTRWRHSQQPGQAVVEIKG